MPNELLFPLLALLPLTYLSGFLHEVGHCLVARAVGYTPTSLGMGTGRPFATFSWKGARVFFARSRPFQGLIFLIHPGIMPSRGAAAWAMAGGILAHAVLVLICFTLSKLAPAGNGVWLPALSLNLVLGLINLVPMSVRLGHAVLRSDGAQILMILKHGLVETPPAMRTQTVELLRPLWSEIGDALGLYGHLMAAALAWSELLDHERAARCYEDARALPVEHTPFIESYTEFIGASIHRPAGRLEAARSAHQRAAEGFRAQGHAVGTLLMELAEGDLHLLDGKPGEAAAVLDRMTTHAEVLQRPALGAALLSSRLVAHLEAGSSESETLLKEWERVRLRYPSHSRDRAVLAALGRARRRQGRLEEAATAYERMLRALQEMHRGLVGLEGASDFGANHAAILAEARETLVEAGREASVTDPAILFPAVELLLEQETDKREALNRRKHRIGFWCSVAYVLMGPAIVVAVVLNTPHPLPGARVEALPFNLVALAVCLSLYGLVGLVYSVFMQIVVRWYPGIRAAGGQRTLLLAVMPWLTWLIVLAAPRR